MSASELGKNSIQKRMMMEFMTTTALVLVLTAAAFFVTEYLRFRENMVVELTTMAKVIGSNSVASIVFDDAEVASETLGALVEDASVMAAVIYDAKGDPLAHYIPKTAPWRLIRRRFVRRVLTGGAENAA